MTNVIEIKNLVKKYGANKAVNNISFEVKQGEILGFLGPNGAGKSTTMNILTGYISCTSGSVNVCGFDILENPNEAKAKIGYLPEQPPLYFDMTVSEYLDFVYELKKVKLPRKAHLAEVMKTVGVDKVRGRLIKNLSKGYKQRVGLAQALVGDPEVLVLDEPTVGLDPRQIIEIRNVIKSLGKKRTIILSTHILQEVTAVCDRVVIINRGKVAAMDTLENLSGGSGSGRYTLRAACDEYRAKNILADLDGIKCVTVLGVKEPGSVDILAESQNAADIRADIFNLFASNGVPILMFKSMELTLEEIFIKVTSETAADDEEEDAQEAPAELQAEPQDAENTENAENNEDTEDNEEVRD